MIHLYTSLRSVHASSIAMFKTNFRISSSLK